MKYVMRRAALQPALNGDWNSSAWKSIPALNVDQFHPSSSGHRPVTQARLAYDEQGLYVIFRVQDRYVRSVQTAHQSAVYTDSCVEFFVQPLPNSGYLNFEMNCGGCLLLHYNEYADPANIDSEKIVRLLEPSLLNCVQIYHSLPAIVLPEIETPVEWAVEYFVPWELFAAVYGPLGAIGGQVWRGNFYKCGDETSHPHWAGWSPIAQRLSFHQPVFFGELQFE